LKIPQKIGLEKILQENLEPAFQSYRAAMQPSIREGRVMRKLRVGCVLLLVLAAFKLGDGIVAAAGPAEKTNESYRVLAPIESGNLLLFPVVRVNNKSVAAVPFITLDEGIKSGRVEVTEAGKAQGLVRRRDGAAIVDGSRFRGDQVNTLVLMNNSNQPLLLLAGEIVTGGKQDRVIAKDRIVPAGSDPIDLSVFCIEPGRWTESSVKFGATAIMPGGSFMVQPTVRQKAMVTRDQQQVWNAVGGAISHMAAASSATVTVDALSANRTETNNALTTTSYAKAMQNTSVSNKVDEEAAPLMKSRDQVLASLRQEHAIGVVVAVRGEIIWADLFADTELLSRYWTKLVRSYAAESLSDGETHTIATTATTVADAQHFLDAPSAGTETTEGEVGIYRYREIKLNGTDTFALESLLPGTGYDVHISKLKLQNTDRCLKTGFYR
jgi:hypothetical protein